MMESFEEEANKLMARSAAKRLKGRLIFINHVCKHNEWTVPQLIKCLKDHGFDEKMSLVKKTVAAKAKARTKAYSENQAPKRSDLDSDDEERSGSESAAESEHESIPEGKNAYIETKHTKVGDITPDLLKVILSQANPISMSIGNLRHLLENRRSRYIKKEPLQELFERCFGIGPENMIPKEMRVIARMVARCVELQVQMAVPEAGIRLPPDWRKNGFFAMKKTSGSIVVYSQVWQDFEDIKLNCDDYPLDDFDDVLINQNWSIKNATIVNTGSGHTLNVMTLWPSKLQKILANQRFIVGGTKTIKSAHALGLSTPSHGDIVNPGTPSASSLLSATSPAQAQIAPSPLQSSTSLVGAEPSSIIEGSDIEEEDEEKSEVAPPSELHADLPDNVPEMSNVD